MSNYSRGANFERAVMRDLERRGYFCVRSAGSHGPIDLVAFCYGGPWFIQVKIDGTIGPQERKTLLSLADDWEAAVVMASRPKRGGILYRRLTGDDKWEEIKP